MSPASTVAIGPLSPPITGPGIKNRYIKRGLEDAGHSLTWVNTLERRPGTVVEFLRQCGDGQRFLVSASTKVRLGTALALARKLARADVSGALLPAGGQFAAELRNLPPGVRGRFVEWFGRFDCILPQSAALADDLRDLFDGRVHVSTLPNLRPVPSERPSPEPYAGTDRPLRLVYVGRLKETKGVHHLLEAVRNLNDTDDRVTLDVFGHFLDGDSYRGRFLEGCEATPNATFRGKLENERVIPTLGGYDAFVFPTYYPGEGFPGALVEAFAAGCLVVASDWNYNDELVSDGHDGLLFEPGSPADLEATLRRLLDDPASVDRFKERSFRKAQDYSVEAVTDRLTTHLERSGW
jgi:glycosyltransferase involved in cell wall biosynthesis